MFTLHRALSAAPRRLPLRAAVTPLAHRYYSTEATSESNETASPEATLTPASEATYPTPKPQRSPAEKPKYTSRTTAKPSSKPALASKSLPPASKTGDKPPTAAVFRANTIADGAAAQSASAYAAEMEGFEAEADEVPASVDWTTSFHGVSAKPVTQEQFKVLMSPMNAKDVEVKPDGIVYLPEIKYRRKLNEAFGPMGWGMVPRSDPVVGSAIVTREYALIVGGRFVAQAQGENGYFSAEQLSSAVEGCKSNALMRCCKDLGIASELWDPHYLRWFRKTQMEEAWGEHAVTKKKRALWFRKGEVNMVYPYKPTK